MSYYTGTIIQHTDCSNFGQYAISTFCGIFLICSVSSRMSSESVWGQIITTLGRHTMSIMIFNWAAFGLLEILLNSLNITHVPNLIYCLMQLSMAILIPFVMEMVYEYIKAIIHRVIPVKFFSI